ncbi:MAG: N-acetyltransferase [Pirellulaceae bacterium]
METTIRPHRKEDRSAIRRVHTEAFGQALEAQLVDALIDGGFTVVSLVAERDSEVVGHVLFSRLEIASHDGSLANSVALAPVAVLPEWQRLGIGSALIREGLDACRKLGEASAFVLGDPAYYGRFGFSAELARRFESPYACEAFQTLPLQSDTLPAGGRIRYAPPFAGL